MAGITSSLPTRSGSCGKEGKGREKERDGKGGRYRPPFRFSGYAHVKGGLEGRLSIYRFDFDGGWRSDVASVTRRRLTRFVFVTTAAAEEL